MKPNHSTLNIASVNVRSISGSTKCDLVLQHLKQFPADVIFLQETHVYSPDSIKNISAQWQGKSFWSPGSPGSSGSAILFKHKSNFQFIDFKRDFEGRVMSVLVSYGTLKLNLVSIYAPNTLLARKTFFNNLHECFFTGSELIVGGDFNCIDSPLDKQGGNINSGFAGKEEVAKLKTDFHLCDIWRTNNPNSKRFTWLNSNGSIACRLDKCLISKPLVKQTRNCTISTFHLSDHDIVSLSLNANSFCDRGPGVWRLNVSVLSDPQYVDLMESFFDSNPKPEIGLLSLWWDFLKNQIRLETVSFCKRKAALKRSHKQKILERLSRAKENLINGTSSAASEVKDLENELKTLGLAEREGVKVRSRSQWIEDGEKPTRYFFGLEKKRASDNYITSLLKPDDSEVTTKDDLFTVITDFYQNLYSPEPTDEAMQSDIIKNLDTSLTAEQVNSCDGLFTLNELFEAPTQMSLPKHQDWTAFPSSFILSFGGGLAQSSSKF